MNMQIGASVLTHSAHGVMTITLNRPELVNVIDQNMRSDLQQIFTSIRTDDEIHAVIITGSKDNFCVGGDIASMEDITEQAALLQMQDIRDTAMAIAGCDKPVIAAIEGHAAGAGIGIALLCDKVIASNSARFTFSFSRVGLGPDWGLSTTLPDRVGRATARKLLWEASKFDTRTALEMGLVDQSCLPGGAMDTAWMEAKILANKPALSVQHVKRYYSKPLDELRLALENEAENQTTCFMSEDFIKSLNVFRNRRRPDSSD